MTIPKIILKTIFEEVNSLSRNFSNGTFTFYSPNINKTKIEINLFGIRSATSKGAFTSKVLTLRIQPFQLHSQMPS